MIKDVKDQRCEKEIGTVSQKKRGTNTHTSGCAVPLKAVCKVPAWGQAEMDLLNLRIINGLKIRFPFPLNYSQITIQSGQHLGNNLKGDSEAESLCWCHTVPLCLQQPGARAQSLLLIPLSTPVAYSGEPHLPGEDTPHLKALSLSPNEARYTRARVLLR